MKDKLNKKKSKAKKKNDFLLRLFFKNIYLYYQSYFVCHYIDDDDK